MAVSQRALKQERVDTHTWAIPLLTLVAGVLALLAVYVLVGHLVTWGQHVLDDVRYGSPRRVHLSGYVGHDDANSIPTQFIALNLDGQINILVLPGGDTDRLSILTGPYMVGADGSTIVPRLGLDDMDRDGHVDLLLTLRGETVVYLNKNGEFRLMTPEERATVMEDERQDQR
jgi:hypothetical protein